MTMTLIGVRPLPRAGVVTVRRGVVNVAAWVTLAL